MSIACVQVLEEEEYHRRKGYYLDSLQRHYYFMNVGNGEVVDACRKVMHALCLHQEPVLIPQLTPWWPQLASRSDQAINQSQSCLSPLALRMWSCNDDTTAAASLLAEMTVCSLCNMQKGSSSDQAWHHLRLIVKVAHACCATSSRYPLPSCIQIACCAYLMLFKVGIRTFRQTCPFVCQKVLTYF